jgi:hypothetical protein
VAWTSAYAQLFTDQLLYWQDRIDDSILKASMASNRHDAGQLLSEDARFDSFIHMLEYLERSPIRRTICEHSLRPPENRRQTIM